MMIRFLVIFAVATDAIAKTPTTVDVKAAEVRKLKLQRMREMIELEMAELEAESEAAAGLAELEASLSDDPLVSDTMEGNARTHNRGDDEISSSDNDDLLSIESSVYASETDTENPPNANSESDAPAEDDTVATVTTEAFQTYQDLLKTSTNQDGTGLNENDVIISNLICVKHSWMAEVVSYQQGLAGIEFIDLHDKDNETELESEMEGIETRAQVQVDDKSSQTNQTSSDNERQNPSDIAVTETLPTTDTARTPELQKSHSVDVVNDTNATRTLVPIKGRARAALARAKAANRARKHTRHLNITRNATEGSVTTNVSTIVNAAGSTINTVTVAVTASNASNSTVDPMIASKTVRRHRHRNRKTANYNGTSPVGTVIVHSNTTSMPTETDDMKVPVADFRGPPARLQSRLTHDQSGFTIGLLSTLGVFCVIIVMVVAGLGMMTHLNDDKVANRRSSLATSLHHNTWESTMSTSAALGIGIGGLQRRPVHARRCSESLPL